MWGGLVMGWVSMVQQVLSQAVGDPFIHCLNKYPFEQKLGGKHCYGLQETLANKIEKEQKQNYLSWEYMFW